MQQPHTDISYKYSHKSDWFELSFPLSRSLFCRNWHLYLRRLWDMLSSQQSREYPQTSTRPTWWWMSLVGTSPPIESKSVTCWVVGMAFSWSEGAIGIGERRPDWIRAEQSRRDGRVNCDRRGKNWGRAKQNEPWVGYSFMSSTRPIENSPPPLIMMDWMGETGWHKKIGFGSRMVFTP